MQSPYVSVANRQAEIMMRIASEFGFTPASRSRISSSIEKTATLFDMPDQDAPAGSDHRPSVGSCFC